MAIRDTAHRGSDRDPVRAAVKGVPRHERHAACATGYASASAGDLPKPSIEVLQYKERASALPPTQKNQLENLSGRATDTPR